MAVLWLHLPSTTQHPGDHQQGRTKTPAASVAIVIARGPEVVAPRNPCRQTTTPLWTTTTRRHQTGLVIPKKKCTRARAQTSTKAVAPSPPTKQLSDLTHLRASGPTTMGSWQRLTVTSKKDSRCQQCPSIRLLVCPCSSRPGYYCQLNPLMKDI